MSISSHADLKHLILKLEVDLRGEIEVEAKAQDIAVQGTLAACQNSND